jgi:hypothetical protein
MSSLFYTLYNSGIPAYAVFDGIYRLLALSLHHRRRIPHLQGSRLRYRLVLAGFFVVCGVGTFARGCNAGMRLVCKLQAMRFFINMHNPHTQSIVTIIHFYRRRVRDAARRQHHASGVQEAEGNEVQCGSVRLHQYQQQHTRSCGQENVAPVLHLQASTKITNNVFFVVFSKFVLCAGTVVCRYR